MSLKWTSGHSDSGILRKSEFKEKKEELFVFGYSCKLFRDDDKALHIDQGKHLIPWMGDETLKIDRYDARGALHDLSKHEAPPGGYDHRVELTKGEQDVELLCDEERYRALHTDEDEEEMYKEEELKRLHAAGYGQVGFNYDTPAPKQEPPAPDVKAEVDEPFLPTPAFKALLPSDIVLPETDKQNVIIEKTAKFIASQGAQMEILIKAKQRDNPQFQFLNRDSVLNPYYMALTALVKEGKWPEKEPEVIEEKPPENEDYLHPSLASTIIESAPSIPSIQYRPSADCDYRLLVSVMSGAEGCAPGEEPPPGTEPLPPRAATLSRAPVMYRDPSIPAQPQGYTQAQYEQYLAYYQQYQAAQMPVVQPTPTPAVGKPVDSKPVSLKSTGLSLMKNYNTDSDSDVSDCDDASSSDSKEKPIITTPPEDVQTVVDKMASYVSRNGAEFAEIVRQKGDPRFSFLEPADVHHPYYLAKLDALRSGNGDKKCSAPVSFSIKKLKEPDPILPKPALPYESSEDEEDKEKQNDKPTDKEESTKNSTPLLANLPTTVFKMEKIQENDLPSVTMIETIKANPIPTPHIIAAPKIFKTEKPVQPSQDQPKLDKQEKPHKTEDGRSITKEIKKSPEKRHERKRKDGPRLEKREKVRKKVKIEREKKRSPEKEREKERKREEDKKKKYNKEDLENEIISLVDNADDMIDLTGDLSDTKGEWSPERCRAMQASRRRRAAAFLAQVGVDPAQLPTTSLASAMVDTLETIRKKKEEQEKKRKREKRRRQKYEYEEGLKSQKRKRKKYKTSDEEDSDNDGLKKKKRKKEKKSKSKKKKKRESPEIEEEPIPQPSIDISSTLKELRTSSPTKEVLQDIEDAEMRRESSASDDEEESSRRRRKKDREYSEGEWSSDTEDDSVSSQSKNGE